MTLPAVTAATPVVCRRPRKRSWRCASIGIRPAYSTVPATMPEPTVKTGVLEVLGARSQGRSPQWRPRPDGTGRYRLAPASISVSTVMTRCSGLAVADVAGNAQVDLVADQVAAGRARVQGRRHRQLIALVENHCRRCSCLRPRGLRCC